MGLLARTSFTNGWMPDADPIAAPPNALLRMDNCLLDELGIVALRQGSATINASPFAELDVHSLYTTVIDGTRLRLVGAGARIYANGYDLGSNLTGTGDVAFGAMQGHVFWARSTTTESYDGATKRGWGIPMTGVAPVPQAVSGGVAWVLAACTSGDTFIQESGLLAYETGQDGQASHALKLTAEPTTGVAQVTKTFTADQDTLIYPTKQTGTVDDLFSLWLYVTDKTAFTDLTVLIDINRSSTGTFEDYYSYVFSETVPSRDEVETPAPPNQDDEWVRRKHYERRVRRPTVTLLSGGWTNLTIKRRLFERVGGTAGVGWSTVKGIRLVANMAVGGTVSVVRVDQIQFVTGALSGAYTYRYVLGRTATSYTALSAPSPESAEFVVSGQSAVVQVPADRTRSTDVNVIWLYRMGGSEGLDTFYRVATQTLDNLPFATTASWEASEVGQGFTLGGGCSNYTLGDEPTTEPTFTYYGVSNHVLSDEDPWVIDVGASTILTLTTGGVAISDTMSDISALTLNPPIEADNTTPPANIIGIAGPYYDRLFCLTTTLLSASRTLNPESFATGHAITVGSDEETAYWVVQALGGLYVGTSRDIYRLDGTFTELPDGTLEAQKVPLNVDHPPVGAAVAKDGPLVIYLAHDGWRVLSGVASSLLVAPTSLLYRGYTRHGISPVNLTSGRVRVTITKGQLVAITPEGSATSSSSVLYRYAFALQRWYRHTYPVAWRSIAREPDGTLIAGDTTGTVWALDVGTTDGGTTIPAVLWTRMEDDGQPFSPKESADLQLNLDTGGATLTANVHLNTSATSSLTGTATSTGRGTADIDVTGLAPWRQVQLRLTGSFSTFVFGGYAVTYHSVPLGVRAWDSGPMDLGNGELVWVRQVRVKARAGADLTITPYFDGVPWPAVTAPVGTSLNLATVLEASCGRSATQGAYKGRVVRLLVTSTAPFFPHWIEVTRRVTAEHTDKRAVRVTAALGGDASG